jgi:glycosyltransferase involved in cell wall biosynthesis
MKLCAVGTRGFPRIEGGVEKHCESLYPLLRSDIDIIVYRRRSYVNSGDSYEHITFIDLPSTKIKGFEAVMHSFLASVNALFRKPDVVHYHNIGPALFSPIVKIRRIPVVLTYHSPNYEHKKWGKFAKYLLLFSEKVALRIADQIVFVNRFQMEKYSKEIRQKSVYIPNGINHLPAPIETDYIEELGLERKKYILSVGRITQEKGFDTLIKAFKLAIKKDFKLVIAGGVEFESNYMKELQEISKDEAVIFTGYVYGDRLAQLYTYAGLFVLASDHEGFPLVLLEAMSYGLEVLVSDIPATHLVDLNDDDYFKRGNYEELGKKITERLQNIRSRKYDLSKYDWNKVADTMSDLFHEVAGCCQ